MAQRRGIRPVLARSPRRQTSWGFGTGGVAVTSISAGGSQFVGSAILPVQEGMTIVRTRGLLRWYLTLATSVGDGFQGAFGIGIATTKAVAAGIGSVPVPTTQQDSENWLFWSPISIHGPVVSSSDLAGATHQDLVIDSKAMRKFTDSEISIYAAIELAEIGTATAELFFDSRMLLKL